MYKLLLTISFEIFTNIYQVTENNPTKKQVEAFVDDNFNEVPNNFDPQGSEFEEWKPSDWSEDIPLFDEITVLPNFLNYLSLIESQHPHFHQIV